MTQRGIFLGSGHAPYPLIGPTALKTETVIFAHKKKVIIIIIINVTFVFLLQFTDGDIDEDLSGNEHAGSGHAHQQQAQLQKGPEVLQLFLPLLLHAIDEVAEKVHQVHTKDALIT